MSITKLDNQVFQKDKMATSHRKRASTLCVFIGQIWLLFSNSTKQLGRRGTIPISKTSLRLNLAFKSDYTLSIDNLVQSTTQERRLPQLLCTNLKIWLSQFQDESFHNSCQIRQDSIICGFYQILIVACMCVCVALQFRFVITQGFKSTLKMKTLVLRCLAVIIQLKMQKRSTSLSKINSGARR